MNEKWSDKLVTQLTPKALRTLSKKPFKEQVLYDRPFGKEFYKDDAILSGEQMRELLNREGYRDMFGEPFSNVGDLTYALEIDVAGLTPDEDTLDDLRTFIGECTRCRLCETRTNIVHGDGDVKAGLMFVGEAPSRDEDKACKILAGLKGQMLQNMVRAMGIQPQEVFFSNLVRCHPLQNGRPGSNEISTCKQFLRHEIAVTRPRVIVTLGSIATMSLLDTTEAFNTLRGRFHDFHGIRVMPTFHPSHLLRDVTKKAEAWKDLKKVRDYLAEKL